MTELTACWGWRVWRLTASRHAQDAGLVEENGWRLTYYHVTPMLAPGSENPLRAVLDGQFATSADDPDGPRRRCGCTSCAFEGELRGARVRMRGYAVGTGRSWAAWSRALGMLPLPLKVADPAGEGYLTVEAA